VSACPSPHLLPGRRPIHALPDRDLRADLEARHGPLPPEVAADPELLQLAMDHHRADSELLDTYAFEPGEPFAIPVTVIGGAADSVPEAALAAWAGHCTGPFQVRLLPGGHFYFRDRPRDLLQVVAGALSASGAAP
ncbi:MAG TPA: thioesterase domain-containing protein, partial [Candidatus Dormibacteraeota bacterium]|nr:thioesterase domain-containing protein [Candidatus Dormibacteraeota bacterium]